MIYSNNIIFNIFFLINILIADVGYNTIYLMEFENQQNQFTNSHMAEALPDLIKENYKFREDITVEYAGDIRPYLNQKSINIDNVIKGLIINGRFLTLNGEFLVEFEAYDIHDWKRLVKRQIFCPINDLICVHDGFLIAIEKSISPFLADDLDINAIISSLDLKKEKSISKNDLDSGSSNDLNQLSDLNDIGVGELNEPSSQQGQYGNRYFREFNFKDISPDPEFSKKQNTENLVSILNQILTNPYEVLIGNLSLKTDPDISRNVIGSISIDYSIRSSLALELLDALPHEKIVQNDGNIILQFQNNNFIFDELLLEKLALMRLQLIPVVFFNSRIGKTQFIIIDSWEEKYNNFDLKDVPMMIENQFRPLFALTPGVNQVQFDMDISKLNTEYNFSIPKEQFGEYTKVAVKFMKEEDLNILLNSQP